MKVINFLKENNNDFNKLTELYGIKVKKYEECLVVLNYDQIDSPKMEPIVQECRGLILDNSANIICRPFDRFFNYGEADTSSFDFSEYVYHPKLDGSLIKAYHWDGEWIIATRGTAFAESEVGGWGITFENLALKAMGFKNIQQFSNAMEDEGMPTHYTYLLELTAQENRVVTQYNKPSVTLLAIRNNLSGDYVNIHNYSTPFWETNSGLDGYTIEEIVKQANSLKDLQEGFVGYDKCGVPRVKVKSAAYVAVHHIRGEGLNPKRISELVLSGEEEEYLTYFPEDRHLVEPYILAKQKLETILSLYYSNYKNIESQKDFALAIKSVPGKSVLFTARKNGITVSEAFNCATLSSRVDMLKNFLN